MAAITVSIPRALTALEERGTGAAVRAMDLTMAETAAAAQGSPRMPVNLGLLRASVAPGPTQETAAAVRGSVVVTGAAALYGLAMEFGRGAGKRGPNWRFLFYGPGSGDWRTGWVNRKLRDAVESLAGELQAEDAQRRKGARQAGRALRIKGPAKRARANFERQAAFLLARAIARKIHAEGIAAHGFASSEVPNVAARFRAHYAAELRAAAVTA